MGATPPAFVAVVAVLRLNRHCQAERACPAAGPANAHPTPLVMGRRELGVAGRSELGAPSKKERRGPRPKVRRQGRRCLRSHRLLLCEPDEHNNNRCDLRHLAPDAAVKRAEFRAFPERNEPRRGLYVRASVREREGNGENDARHHAFRRRRFLTQQNRRDDDVAVVVVVVVGVVGSNDPPDRLHSPFAENTSDRVESTNRALTIGSELAGRT